MNHDRLAIDILVKGTIITVLGWIVTYGIWLYMNQLGGM